MGRLLAEHASPCCNNDAQRPPSSTCLNRTRTASVPSHRRRIGMAHLERRARLHDNHAVLARLIQLLQNRRALYGEVLLQPCTPPHCIPLVHILLSPCEAAPQLTMVPHDLPLRVRRIRPLLRLRMLCLAGGVLHEGLPASEVLRLACVAPAQLLSHLIDGNFMLALLNERPGLEQVGTMLQGGNLVVRLFSA